MGDPFAQPCCPVGEETKTFAEQAASLSDLHSYPQACGRTRERYNLICGFSCG